VVADNPSWQVLKLLQDKFKMCLGTDYFVVNHSHLDWNLDYGFQYAKNDYYCIVPDDIVFADGWDGEIMKVMENKNDRIVSSVYYSGNTMEMLGVDLGWPELKYVKGPKKSEKIGFDVEALNAVVPAPHNHISKSGSPPVLVFHKDIYKRVNGINYFATQGQAFELMFLARAIKLGFQHVVTSNTVFYHFGTFGNTDLQNMASLPESQGVYKCNVCSHIELSRGNIEYLITDGKRAHGGSERGRITMETGLFLCDRCKRDGWIVNRVQCTLERTGGSA